MMIEFFLGLVLTFATLVDVFDTVLVPGSSRGILRIAPRVRRVVLPIARRASSRADNLKRIPLDLAPSILIATFCSWMVLLFLGFALMVAALGSFYTPRVHNFSEALFTAGSSIVTIGESSRNPEMAARWVSLFAGFSGLAVVTMAITYVIGIQGALKERDASVAKLSSLAGSPPTGINILESLARTHARSELDSLFREWRVWSAATLYSHSANPILAYFSSVGSEMDWPAAVGAVLDAACIYSSLVTKVDQGSALLFQADATRLLKVFCRNYSLSPEEHEGASIQEIESVKQRVESVGFNTSDLLDGYHLFNSRRKPYLGNLRALAAHLGVDGV